MNASTVSAHTAIIIHLKKEMQFFTCEAIVEIFVEKIIFNVIRITLGALWLPELME
jgi:hypothetical protein